MLAEEHLEAINHGDIAGAVPAPSKRLTRNKSQRLQPEYQ